MKKTESRCPVFSKCGACAHIDVPYGEQLSKKKEYLKRLLAEYGSVDEMVGMKDPFHYRCKVTGIFVQGKSGKIEAGNYYEGSKNIVPVNKCYLEDVRADSIIPDVAELLHSFKMKIYNDRTGYGNFRYSLVRVGKNTGEIMLILVTRSPVFPSKNNFVKALREKHPEITTIVQNINDRTDSMILGNRNNVLYGKGYIEDELCGCRFRISPASFYQVNPIQTEKLYSFAVGAAGIRKGVKVIDAYCGTGTIGIICAKNGAEVTGVELNKSACRDAKVNAELNGLDNIKFYNDDAGKFMQAMASRGDSFDVLVMDPPRAGASREFIGCAVKLAPEKIVYVSCSIETLERDLRIFKREGYRASFIQPVDMFPHTMGIENVVCLEKAEKPVEKPPVKVPEKEEQVFLKPRGKSAGRAVKKAGRPVRNSVRNVKNGGRPVKNGGSRRK